MQNSDKSGHQPSTSTQGLGENKEKRKKQQQTDPQKTELKGFIDPNEKLEPDLEGKKTDKTKGK